MWFVFSQAAQAFCCLKALIGSVGAGFCGVFILPWGVSGCDAYFYLGKASIIC